VLLASNGLDQYPAAPAIRSTMVVSLVSSQAGVRMQTSPTWLVVANRRSTGHVHFPLVVEAHLFDRYSVKRAMVAVDPSNAKLTMQRDHPDSL